MSAIPEALENLAEQCEFDARRRAEELRKLTQEISRDSIRAHVKVFKALSDPTRLTIMCLLLRREMCVCELMVALDAGQSAVSRHLRILRDAGLIIDRREGKWVFYRVQEEKARENIDLLNRLVER